jgi:type VI secretion system secreted protein Hcp
MSSSTSKRARRLRRAGLIAVPAALALAAGSVVAYASIPASDGTISACVGPALGSVRIIDSGASCSKLETPVHWNQKGPKGDTGATGVTGAKGDTGAAGTTGAQGPQGPAGPAGSSGSGGASAAPIIGGEALAGGTADAYLKLEDSSGLIPGDSTAPGYESQIDVKAFSFGVSNTGTGSASGGAGAGKATFQDFRIHKLYDRSSPQLFADVASGKHLVTATLTFVSRGANPQPFLVYTFSDLLVSDYEQGGTAEPPLLENVAFDFAKVTVTYTPQLPGGQTAPPVTTGWNVATNNKV